MQEQTVLPNINMNVINYNVTDAAIAELKARFRGLLINNNNDYKLVFSALSEIRTLRVNVEKMRVEYKKDALEYGRRVDAEAKRVTSALEDIENPLKEAKKAYEEEKERIRLEKERLEKERIDNIEKNIFMFNEILLNSMYLSIEALKDTIRGIEFSLSDDPFDYQEFKDKALVTKKQVLEKLKATLISKEKEEQERIAQQEALRLERERLESERLANEVKLELERKAMEEDKAKIKSQQEEVQKKLDESIKAMAINEAKVRAEQEEERKNIAALRQEFAEKQAAAIAEALKLSEERKTIEEQTKAFMKSASFKSAESEPEEEMIMIKKSEYDYLLDRNEWLKCLEHVGVDDWKGAKNASDLYHKVDFVPDR